MELNFLSVGAFVCCMFVHSLACESRRLFFARNMLHSATWQRGNAMCLSVAVLAVQKHSISLIYTSEAVRAQPRSKILSPALFLHSHSLSFAPRTLCPFVWLLAFPFPLFNKQLLASAAITTRVAAVAAAAKNLFASACQKILCLVLPMVPLLPLKAVGGGDAATSVELFYASAAAAAVVAADACRKQCCALSQY